MSKIQSLVLTLTAVLALGWATAANAGLLAYDGFDYPAGPLGGQAGGIGFNGGWILGGNANNNLVKSGGFGYTDGDGRTLTVSGNRAFTTGDGTAAGDNTGGNNATASPRRTLTFYRGDGLTPDVTWMSFVALRTGKKLTIMDSGNQPIDYARAAGVQIFRQNTVGSTAQGTELLSIGRGGQNTETASLPNDTWGMLNAGSSLQTVASDVPFGDPVPVFMLLRIDHAVGANPANDTARLWINPSLATEPTLGTEDALISANQFNATSTADYNFNQLRIFAGGFTANVGYGSIEYDEIRIGTTFDDVTPHIPEPATVLLVGLGLVGLLSTGRRRA